MNAAVMLDGGVSRTSLPMAIQTYAKPSVIE